MAMNGVWLVRVVAMGVLLLFSFIEMALSAAYIAKLNDFPFEVDTPSWVGLALAISLITLIAVAPLLMIDFLRRGAITSWVMVELAVTGVLMILWLATGATAADASNGRTVDCGGLGGDDEFFCRTYQAVEAFAFINWLILLFYFGGLLALSVLAQVRRNPPWQSTVRDMNFFAKGNAPMAVPMQQAPWPNTAQAPQA